MTQNRYQSGVLVVVVVMLGAITIYLGGELHVNLGLIGQASLQLGPGLP